MEADILKELETFKLICSTNGEKFIIDCSISCVKKHSESKDNFAIGFADWVNANDYKYPTQTTTDELFKIYKSQL